MAAQREPTVVFGPSFSNEPPVEKTSWQAEAMAIETRRLRKRSWLLFALLVAVIMVASFSATAMASALGFDVAGWTRILAPVAYGTTLFAAVCLIVAVLLELRNDAVRARDFARITALRARLTRIETRGYERRKERSESLRSAIFVHGGYDWSSVGIEAKAAEE